MGRTSRCDAAISGGRDPSVQDRRQNAHRQPPDRSRQPSGPSSKLLRLFSEDWILDLVEQTLLCLTYRLIDMLFGSSTAIRYDALVGGGVDF